MNRPTTGLLSGYEPGYKWPLGCEWSSEADPLMECFISTRSGVYKRDLRPHECTVCEPSTAPKGTVTGDEDLFIVAHPTEYIRAERKIGTIIIPPSCLRLIGTLIESIEGDEARIHNVVPIRNLLTALFQRPALDSEIEDVLMI